jgi:hypothetical protein
MGTGGALFGGGDARVGSTSSISVFQAPQPGQRPVHCGDLVPHSLQQ